jgi:hypothetical protein
MQGEVCLLGYPGPQPGKRKELEQELFPGFNCGRVLMFSGG